MSKIRRKKFSKTAIILGVEGGIFGVLVANGSEQTKKFKGGLVKVYVHCMCWYGVSF